MATDSPLILTLQLDESSFAFFNAQRQRYFPPERNYLKAHLTLFHHLPPAEPFIDTDLQAWCLQTAPFAFLVSELRSLGKGVAYKIDCPPLLHLHRQMQQRWQAWLLPQDRQKLWPHITVQNKVSPAQAQETLATLQAGFEPFNAIGKGLCLWSYQNGPWQFIKSYPFKAG